MTSCGGRVPFKFIFGAFYRAEEIPFISSLLRVDNEGLLNSEFRQMLFFVH